MSIKILQERCQQLKKLEVAIEKLNTEITEMDYSVEGYWENLQELGEMNRHLNNQRESCREAILLHAVEMFGNV